MSVGELSDREERPAYVDFERRPIEDKVATLAAGHSVSIDVDWVLVNKPYSRDVFEQKAQTWLDKQAKLVKDGRINPKFLEYWNESYKRWKEGQEAPINGTDIRNWSLISPATVQNLLAIGIKTIEDLALVNNEGLRRIGMGGIDLKNKANAYLKSGNDHGAIVLENTELKRKTSELEGTVKSLQDQMTLLMSRMDTSNAPPVALVPESISLDDIVDVPRETIEISELDSLKAQYEQKFGKKPHHFLKEEGLRKKLAE